ncbi:MAG: NUDIX domain-containing protein [Actinomycetia bacterium]|nr:NUDIX domain-containing protein [Actinomycetes bacterium]
MVADQSGPQTRGQERGQRRAEVCVGAIATRTNELLMVRRATQPGLGRWSVPGGRVEPGETLAEAVVRELAEETALHGVCGALVGWTEIIDAHHHFVVMDFAVTLLDDHEPTPGDDASEAAWVPVWTVPELDLVDGLAEFLSDAGIIETLT